MIAELAETVNRELRPADATLPVRLMARVVRSTYSRRSVLMQGSCHL